MKKLKHREVKQLSQGHKASKKQKKCGFEHRQSASVSMHLILLSAASHGGLKQLFSNRNHRDAHQNSEHHCGRNWVVHTQTKFMPVLRKSKDFVSYTCSYFYFSILNDFVYLYIYVFFPFKIYSCFFL